MGTRWQDTSLPRGDDYDARWAKLAAAGKSVHGEADLVGNLLRESGGTRVLDAGCGTGRVAIELANRGFSVVGIDSDAAMLDAAAHQGTCSELGTRRSCRCGRGSGRRVRHRGGGRQRDDLF